MMPDVYDVYFYAGTGGTTSVIRVTAMGEKQAEILAQAERIKAGLTYDVIKIIKL